MEKVIKTVKNAAFHQYMYDGTMQESAVKDSNFLKEVRFAPQWHYFSLCRHLNLIWSSAETLVVGKILGNFHLTGKVAGEVGAEGILEDDVRREVRKIHRQILSLLRRMVWEWDRLLRIFERLVGLVVKMAHHLQAARQFHPWKLAMTPWRILGPFLLSLLFILEGDGWWWMVMVLENIHKIRHSTSS